MAKTKKSSPRVKAEATARAELVAKATYARKHTTTEVVPPDVTRAKASAWLDLISPITEWAGLKGDALKFKRDLLRIQQEETLLRVALKVQALLAQAQIVHQVPRKILVPALEKASLEEADDDVMVDRWANLLASAAEDVKVQPRFVGILEEMTGRQAECLERVAFNRYAEFKYPASAFGDCFLDFAHYNIEERVAPKLEAILQSEQQVPAAFAEIERVFRRPGVLLEYSAIRDLDGSLWEGYDVVADFQGAHDESDLSILESLGLVRYVALKVPVFLPGQIQRFAVLIHYHHLTELGVEFCQVCSRPRVELLEAINETSRKNGVEYTWD